MDIAIKVLNQVIVVFILIAVGFAATKLKMINKEGAKQMTGILLNIVTPCVLINSYQEKDFKPEFANGLLMGALFTILSIGITILISHFIFRKEKSNRYRVERFSAVYSNCGFMAIPLLSAALGADGVFYGSAYLAMFTVFYWTIGVFTYTEDMKALSFKNIIINPGVVATVVAIAMFLLKIKLPTIVMQPISFLAGLNTPVAMLILGFYMVGIDFVSVLKHKGVYIVSVLRLLLYPMLSLGIAKLLNLSPEVAQAVMISSACPTATVTTLFAARFKMDAGYASQLVSITTLLSILTIPLIMLIMGYIY